MEKNYNRNIFLNSYILYHCNVAMLILFGVTNSEGVEHTIPIDIEKAGSFAYELENNQKCEWRIKDVLME